MLANGRIELIEPLGRRSELPFEQGKRDDELPGLNRIRVGRRRGAECCAASLALNGQLLA
jgi:hypothetical protein